jgi:aminobenzoyl-glutamate transport protein
MALSPAEKRGLAIAGVVFLAVMGVFAALILIPGAPLHGTGQPALANGTPAPGERSGDRWSQVIVPIIFFAFVLPGAAFGRAVGLLNGQRDLIDAFYHGIRSIIPVLAISFFMGQFVNYFQYTGLDRMLAYAGGSLLIAADLPTPLLLVLFIMLVIAGDFAISGMLSKYGILAPIFIPMFMMTGISPELTTAAYRIGDSVVNIITPMNSYLLIILAVLQKYQRNAGLGSLIALMVPYSVVLGTLWTAFLLVWWLTGYPLGTGAPLEYVPSP